MIKSHINSLQNDPDYYELNKQMLSASLPPFMWGVLKDVGIEIATEIIKKYTGIKAGSEIVDAVKNLATGGSMLDFMWDVGRVVTEYFGKKFPVLAALDISLDIKDFYDKIKGPFGQFNRLYLKITQSANEAVMNKLYNVLKKNGNLVDKLGIDGFGNLKVGNTSANTFWSNLQQEFEMSATGFINSRTLKQNFYIQIPNTKIYLTLYPDAASGSKWTIEITLDGPSEHDVIKSTSKIFKFRLDLD